jgi:hypothetical protein
MLLDKELTFTYTSATDDSQTIADADNVSYNQLDLGQGAAASTPTRQLGNGAPMYLITQVVTKDTGHTTPTLNIKLVAATDTAFTSSRIIAQTGDIANALLADNQIIVLPVPPSIGYRYWRVEYHLGNADNSYVVRSFLADCAPSPLFYTQPSYLA